MKKGSIEWCVLRKDPVTDRYMKFEIFNSGDRMKFDTKEDLIIFLKSVKYSDTDIEKFEFYIETKCPDCDTKTEIKEKRLPLLDPVHEIYCRKCNEKYFVGEDLYKK